MIMGISGCRGSNIIDSKEATSLATQLCNTLARLTSDSILLEGSTEMFGAYESKGVAFKRFLDADIITDMKFDFKENESVDVSVYDSSTGNTMVKKLKYKKIQNIVIIEVGSVDWRFLITDKGLLGVFGPPFFNSLDNEYLNEDEALVTKVLGDTETAQCSKIMYGTNPVYSCNSNIYGKTYFIVGNDKRPLKLLSKNLCEFKLVNSR